MTSFPTEGSKKTDVKPDMLSAPSERYRECLDEMKKLVNQHCEKGTALGSPEATTASVREVVEKYRLRFANPDWPRGMPELIKASKKAEDCLLSLLKAVEQLHPLGFEEIENHLRLQLELGQKLNGLPVPDSIAREHKVDKNDLIKVIARLYTRTLFYGLVVPSTYAFVKQRKTKSGRTGWATTANYVEPVIDLIRAWYSLTGVPAVSPKQPRQNRNTEEATQASTEFVRRGLLMIDDGLEPLPARQKAITAIRSALKIEKKEEAVMQQRLATMRSIELELQNYQG